MIVARNVKKIHVITVYESNKATDNVAVEASPHS